MDRAADAGKRGPIVRAEAGDAGAPYADEAEARGVVWHVPNGPGYGRGVAFADLDRDGDDDLLALGNGAEVGLFVNDGAGRFAPHVLVVPGLVAPSGLLCVDHDADGDLDVLITQRSAPNLLLDNLGGAPPAFEEVAARAGVADDGESTGASAADVNGDGRLDLHVPNYGSADRLYLNVGGGSFEEAGAAWGVADPWRGFQSVLSDLDLDGDPDLYVSNDKRVVENTWMHNRLYRNDGSILVDVSAGSGADVNIMSMGVAVGDFDANGLPDLYCTNLGAEPNALLLNAGDGRFVQSEATAGVESYRTGWAAIFLDLDSDGHEDLFVCNAGSPNRLYRHGGSFPCTDVAPALGLDVPGNSFCAAAADVDGDGDLDLVVQTNGAPLALHVNREPQGHWIHLDVVGPLENPFAIGAHVAVRAGATTWTREVRAGGNSYKSCNGLVRHVGLGTHAAIDAVTVTWPDGAVRALAAPAVDRRWRVHHPDRLGDADLDGDVDLDDVFALHGCTTAAPGCEALDLDGDGAITPADATAFLDRYAGPVGDCDGDGQPDLVQILLDAALDADADGRLDACVASCPADCGLLPDGRVDVVDVLDALAAWGAGGPCDLDADGATGAADVAAILLAWGGCG